MPILDVEVVGRLAHCSQGSLAQRLADAAGEALGTPPGQTWVRVRELNPEHYAENGGTKLTPVFVRVLQYAPPADLAEQTTRLTRAIAATCGRPEENVHLLYEPPGRGRVAFGGKLA